MSMACWRGSDAPLKAAAHKRIPLYKSMQAIKTDVDGLLAQYGLVDVVRPVCSCGSVLLCASFTFAIETTLPFDGGRRRRQHGRPVVLA
jgi:hypothetical protein